MSKHICSQCLGEFNSEEGYLNHTCKASGKTPTEPEHFGSEMKSIANAALKRGAARKAKKAKK